MAEQINEEYLVSALRDKLQAETVEVTDVSGTFCLLYPVPTPFRL